MEGLNAQVHAGGGSFRGQLRHGVRDLPAALRQALTRVGAADQNDEGQLQLGGFRNAAAVLLQRLRTAVSIGTGKEAAPDQAHTGKTGLPNLPPDRLKTTALESLPPDRDAAEAGPGVGIHGGLYGPGPGSHGVEGEAAQGVNPGGACVAGNRPGSWGRHQRGGPSAGPTSKKRCAPTPSCSRFNMTASSRR